MAIEGQQSTEATLQRIMLEAQKRPEFFFREVLGWQPWWKQAEIAEAVKEAMEGKGPRRIAVRSGNGTGKTAIAARVMLWALWSLGGNLVVVTTAPTNRQVTELLWREARSAYHGSRYPLKGRLYEGQAKWELGPERYALGMSPEDTRPEHFQGFHAERILFIVDEASGVPEAHWEAIKGSLLAGNAVLLAIGNPTRLHGEFYEAFHGRAELWRRMHISALETPNVREGVKTGGSETRPYVGPGGATVIPGLVTWEGVEEARRDWGEESALYRVRILGEFPASAANGLILLEWLEQAAMVAPEDGPMALGVDVARSGEDESAVALLAGNRVEEIVAWRGQDTMKTVAAVKGYAEAHPGMAIAVDDGGVGGGVVDRLRELEVAVQAVKFGGAPDGRMSAHFRNKGSEAYWVLREQLREGRLRVPPELAGRDRLMAQLTQIEWEQESDRAIRVHKRGGDGRRPSPDRADALALAVEARLRATRGVGVWV